MKKPNIKSINKQNGVALITALLVVALASIIAVNMTERQQYDIRRLQNILNNQQAYYYAVGGEAWAKGLLYKDKESDKRNKGTDNLFEDWAQPLPLTLIENGSISGEITDLQGLYNINNLFISKPDDKAEKDRLKQHKLVFNRLLNLLEIETTITDAIIDWLDNDVQSSPNGAEDDVYLTKTPAYRTANRMMHNPSELLLVEGIDAEIFERLKPFICTLPEITTVNINTAPAEVIASLTSQLNLEKAGNIVEDRSTAFDGIKEFIDETRGYAQNKNTYELEITPLIGVTSQYFQVKAVVKIDNINKQLISYMKRNPDNTINTILRGPGDN